MTQLTLDDASGHGPIRNDLEEAYRLWLSDHANVFALFERFALQMLENRRRFGIGALAERVRWEIATTWANDTDGYKINNNHRAYIARDLIMKHPALSDLIECRVVKGENP